MSDCQNQPRLTLANSPGVAWRPPSLFAVGRAWHRFWFEPATPTGLGILRILNGLMLVYTHLIWVWGMPEFFTETAWLPNSLVQQWLQSGHGPTFWTEIPASLQSQAHAGSMLILVAYTLGLCTPITSVMAAIITISYAQRTLLANFGLDQVNALLVTYLAIGGSGATLSLDRLFLGSSSWDHPTSRNRLGLRLIQVHICIIYFFAAVSKLQGEAWWNGTAIWLALANFEYQSLDLTYLCWFPGLLNALTLATIAWEISFPFLVWQSGWRFWLLAGGIAIHLGIGAFLGMWTFGLAMISTYVAFIWDGGTPLDTAKEMTDSREGRVPVQPSSYSRQENLETSAIVPQSVDRIPAPHDVLERSWMRSESPSTTNIEFEGPRLPFDNDSRQANARVLCIAGPTLLREAFPENLRRHGLACTAIQHVASAKSVLNEGSYEGVVWDATHVEPEVIDGFCAFMQTQWPLVGVVIVMESRQLVRLTSSPESETIRIMLLPCQIRSIRQTLQDVLRVHGYTPTAPFPGVAR